MKPIQVAVFGLSAVIVAGSLVLANYRPAPKLSAPNLLDTPRHPITAEMEKAADAVVGGTAPEISLIDTDKKPQTLSGYLAKGPVVLVMIKDGCPCSIEAQPFFNELASHFSGKATFVGVTDAPWREASKYKDDFAVPFPILMEPGMKTFEAYHSPRSVYTTIINPSGKVVKMFPGYSKQILNEIASTVATEANTKAPVLNLAMAPERANSGCEFGAPAGTP